MAIQMIFENEVYYSPRKTFETKAKHNGDSPVHLIVKAWKIHKDLPLEGEESKIWDRNHFAEHARTAKRLLDEFGLEGAVECIEYVANYMHKLNLSYTIHTINKRSDLYREFLARKGR